MNPEPRGSSTLILTAIILALFACDESYSLASGRVVAGEVAAEMAGRTVVARVNGKAIAIRGIAPEGGLDSLAAPDATAFEALDKLIDQELLARKALEMHLDRDPEVLLDIEEATHQILARRYIERLMRNPEPGADEIRHFYRNHPALFEQRRIYRFDELIVSLDRETLAAFKAVVAGSGTLNEVATWLQTRNRPFRMAALIKSAEQIPPEALPRMAAMKNRQMLVFETAGRLSVIHLLQSMNAPLSLEDVAPAIAGELARQKRQAFTRSRAWQLRESARIEYLGPFAGRKPPPPTAGDGAPVSRSPPGLL